MVFRRNFICAALTVAALLAPVGGPALAEGSGVDARAAASAPGVQRERARMNQRVFDRVWHEVRREYYDPGLHGVDWDSARRFYRPQALAAQDDRELYRALGDMLDLLNDDHADASPPAAVRRQDALHHRRAVMGLTLYAEEEGRWRVEQVRAGSPAAEAGVGLGWRLETIDGRDWGPDIDIIEGQPLALSLIDDAGVRRQITLTPRTMDPQPFFVTDRSRPGVVVLRVLGFEQGLGRWMGEQLASLPPETDVIVDLRGNPGGRLTEAEAVLGCFLPQQQPWATRRGRSGRVVVLRTLTRCGDLSAPVANDVAVLVDRTSRSAAELTPAALQEAGRAVVVGENTAGAVLISQESMLPDGGRLTLSRADFITSGGVRLEKRGVAPDIAATRSLQDRITGADPMMDAAVAALAN